MTLAQAYKKQFGKVSYPFMIYDSKGNETYFENNYGFWSKYEYDSKGNETYFENSYGTIRGKKQSSCDGKIVEIDGKKYKLKEL